MLPPRSATDRDSWPTLASLTTFSGDRPAALVSRVALLKATLSTQPGVARQFARHVQFTHTTAGVPALFTEQPSVQYTHTVRVSPELSAALLALNLGRVHDDRPDLLTRGGSSM